MTQLIETCRGAVYPWQCDHMGHMNVMWYVGKFDEGTWNLFSMLGVTPSFLREHHRGMAAVQQDITYRRELHAGDVIVVRSAMLEVRDKALKFVHEMKNDHTGEIAAVCVLTGVHTDAKTRKACALPEDVRRRARERIVDYELPRRQ
ncbi:MAG: acyl-CoA thioesterase [Betaproteobacteria bacterium]|nr:acyl-CoA thioesterase [Betaproteobacteria bacterium]